MIASILLPKLTDFRNATVNKESGGGEKSGTMYCCAHCAKDEGATERRDRA